MNPGPKIAARRPRRIRWAFGISFALLAGLSCLESGAPLVAQDAPERITISISQSHLEVALLDGTKPRFASRQDGLLPYAPPILLGTPPRDPNTLRQYGQIHLGDPQRGAFNFCVDYNGVVPLVVYFDSNRDLVISEEEILPLYDKELTALTDAVKKKNSVSMLCEKEVWLKLTDVEPRLGSNDIHFGLSLYCRSYAFKLQYLAHYTSLQMVGRANVGGRDCKVAIVEYDYHDLDFTNDGIWVDLNQNDKFESGEHLMPDDVGKINGKSYRFDVAW